ncbi:MAG: hypothetical protein GXO64_01530 [Candidatus Micrarchaeota archaeon]|nr:hypothetical protein [Candidatus Micrarchaeota archaeon]
MDSSRKKRGFILSLDAVLAAGIIALVIVFMSSLSISHINPEMSYKRLYSTAKDTVVVMENAKMASIYDMLDTDFIEECEIGSDDLNRTILDMIGYYWASGYDECAENLTRTIYENIFPELIGFAVAMDGSTIYSTDMSNPDFISRVSTVASGYEKEKVVRGYISKVYITKASRTNAAYVYFGGYVGDGNITTVIELPEDANVTEFYAEADFGNNFTLYINGNSTGNYTPIIENMSASNFTICNLTYHSNYCQFTNTGNNTIDINFTTQDNNYIGGGFLRITYKTSEILNTEITSGSTKKKIQYFPGIKGLINLYSSFYVPGQLNAMSMFLHYKNNISVDGEGVPLYAVLGNTEVYRSNETGLFNITLNDTTLSGMLNYSNISLVTVPLRVGIEPFFSTFGVGRSDSVLITDRSGSMDGCDVDSSSCEHSDCDSGTSGCQNMRMDIAKDVDDVFVDTMLNVSGNRVGLNGYGATICSSYGMSNDTTGLHSRIDSYDYDCGCTCISCGIIKAIENIETNPVTETLIERKSVWFYNTSYPSSEPANDSGGKAWYEREYNESSWSNASAILGFESSSYSPNVDTDIGNNGGNYYFRRHFNVSDISDISEVELFILADDAVEVYVNGHPVFNDSFTHQAQYWNRGGVIFEDGFESGTLSSWTEDSNSDGGVVAIDNEPHSGSYNVKFYGDGSSPNEMWIEKTINLTGRTNVTLSYFWTTEDLESTDHGYLDIYDGLWHNAVEEYGLNNGRTTWPDYTSNSLEYAWEDIDLDDYSLASDFKLRFRCTAVHNERWDTFLVDDISVKEKLTIDKSLLRNGDNVIAVKLRNGDSDSAKFDLELNYTQSRYKAIMVMSDGGSNTMVNGAPCYYSSSSENPAKDEAVDLACEARDRYGITIYSVAFGDGAYPDTLKKAACWNCSSGTWLEGEGEDNCSRFYQSSSAEELMSIYTNIASDIANATYRAQTITASGDISLDNILYPDSYLEFNYTPQSQQLSYGQIMMTYETQPLRKSTGDDLITDETTGTKEGWFTIPTNSTVLDAKITSYSSSYWTDRLWINSSSTPGQNWTHVFWLANFSDDYETLGDPYIINIPPQYLSPGENNSVRIGTGLIPDNGTGASSDDRIIYTISIGGIGLVGYSGVFPKLNGSTVTVWSDTDGDNVADSSFSVSVGPNPNDIFDPANDSIDDAFMRLLDKLNFVFDANSSSYGDGSIGNPYDGVNQTNPIDVEITTEISFDSNYISDVPSMWGPATVEVLTWF